MATRSVTKPSTSLRLPKQGQTEFLRQFHGADLPLEEAGPSLASVRDALDRLFHMASADEAGSAAKQQLEVANNELAALEHSLKSSGRDAGAGMEAMDAASEPGIDDVEAWTNDLVGVVQEESRESVRSRITKRIGESWVAAGTEEGHARSYRQVIWKRGLEACLRGAGVGEARHPGPGKGRGTAFRCGLRGTTLPRGYRFDFHACCHGGGGGTCQIGRGFDGGW